MTAEEQVQTFTTQVEPLTGDKRPREDGLTDEGLSPPPASRSNNNNNNFGNGAAAFQQQQQQQMSGNFMQSMMAGGGLQLMQTNGVPTMPGHDALYIGDLQWVRLLCRLPSSCVHLSELVFLSFRLLFRLVDN
jgi:hypothetical protein